MKRREFLKGLGGIVIVASAGGAWRAYDQRVFTAGSGPAYQPWQTWRDEAKGELALVRAAILAANPHNTQPWMFHVTAGCIDIYADTARNLGTFDPYLREMYLGLGCALENLLLAAAAGGFRTQTRYQEGTLGPIPASPAPERVARVELEPAPVAPSRLFEAIPHRHTNRGPYDVERPLSDGVADELRSLSHDDPNIQVQLYREGASKARCGELVIAATEAIIADAPMVHDSERWFRHSWREIQASRDGPTLEAAGLSPLKTAFAKLLPAGSPEQNHRHWLAATREVQVPTAAALGLITVRDLYDVEGTLRAGRLWQRLHLWATMQGLAMQPLNQPVELVDRDRQLGRTSLMARNLAELTGDVERRPTFAFRVGYPLQAAAASPRRPLEWVIGSLEWMLEPEG